jgi:hypothetical protein
MQDASYPHEIRQLGRTKRRWRTQIAAWHQAQVTNVPTETTFNGLAKRIKRADSAYATSSTGASASCSTPANPTGPSSTPSPHDPAQIRRADIGASRRWRPRSVRPSLLEPSGVHETDFPLTRARCHGHQAAPESTSQRSQQTTTPSAPQKCRVARASVTSLCLALKVRQSPLYIYLFPQRERRQ